MSFRSAILLGLLFLHHHACFIADAQNQFVRRRTAIANTNEEHFVACPKPGNCAYANYVAPDSEVHEIRCCSSFIEPIESTALDWMYVKRGRTCPYVASPPLCPLGTYNEAVALCSLIPDGRLCTVQEINEECAGRSCCCYGAEDGSYQLQQEDKYFVWTSSERVSTETLSADVQTIREQIRELIRSNHALAPKFLRLAFHDCIGGCDGCVDMTDLDNTGLEIPISVLSTLVSEWKGKGILSRADIWALAAMVGSEVTQAQHDFYMEYAGRIDCEDSGKTCLDENSNPQECRQDLGDFRAMPSPDILTHDLLDFFAENFGFNAQEVVALMGAHSIGTASREHSGFNGPKGWDNTNYFLDNNYYVMLVGAQANGTETNLEEAMETAPGWTQETVENGGSSGLPDRMQWFRRRSLDTERIISLNADVGLCRDLSGQLNPASGEVSCGFKNPASNDQPARCPHAAATIDLMSMYRSDETKFLQDFEAVLKKMILNGYPLPESQLTAVPPPTTPIVNLPSISASQATYESGQAVGLTFENPTSERAWIAIRRADSDPHELTGSSEAWSWVCGTSTCSDKQQISGSFDLEGIGNGLWRAYLIATPQTSPYQAIAFTNPFPVGEAKLSTSLRTYTSGDTIEVTFANPLSSRIWMAVFPANANPHGLTGSTQAWAWPCGSASCNGDTLSSGVLNLNGIGDGLWRVYMMTDMFSPYGTETYSNSFAVGNVDLIEINASKKRYNIGESVEVTFDNPGEERFWIGVYPANTNPQDIDISSEAWSWPCGSRACSDQSLPFGTVELSVGEGEWRAYFIIDMTFPYQSAAYTDSFVLNG
mmetsp:Transcript_19626/g.30259  ORF Transcript_19626/g.30259 Transcript_19626/m.30259 type:complete len:826 (-) Transcript_19626:36-2513(-)|eukprot:CAMPEP_0195281166 /NCGR_PEP_ID=MMETSP0707-20130614/592_1 /TAXON_ID=33640 /ORGANISM="Asterionellopsis glacialis, Strain CCMP134" /LENGTH=825 /DNA_ID=CAMNT_0040340025 /DNA_START=83 /DNA_END=2560 /DNA_ORIENTATION=+